MSSHSINPFYRTTAGDAFGYDPTRGMNNPAFKEAYQKTSKFSDPVSETQEFIRTAEATTRAFVLSPSQLQQQQHQQDQRQQQSQLEYDYDDTKMHGAEQYDSARSTHRPLARPSTLTARELLPYEPQNDFSYPSGAEKLPQRLPDPQLKRHIPTYSGFVPGLHDNIGMSFSKASAKRAEAKSNY